MRTSNEPLAERAGSGEGVETRIHEVSALGVVRERRRQ